MANGSKVKQLGTPCASQKNNVHVQVLEAEIDAWPCIFIKTGGICRNRSLSSEIDVYQ